MAAPMKKSVLFICLGNICRSPMAEAVFAHLVKQKGLSDQWHIDSAALEGWHVGGSPDSRASNVLKREKIDYTHTVRQITQDDFRTFDTIFGMDHDNIRCLTQRAPKDSRAQIKLLGEYDPQKTLVIEDPYYGDEADFDVVYEQVDRCCKQFLKENS